MKEWVEKAPSYKVTQSNDLIRRTHLPLTVSQQKLVAMAISMIQPTDKEFKKYQISVADYCKLTGIRKDRFYSDFRAMFDDMREKEAKAAKWIETDDVVFPFSWFATIVFRKKMACVELTFNPYLTKYLLELKKNFTGYELWCVLRFKTKYGFRLFELLRSYGYGKKSYTVDYDIEELKTALVCSQYSNFADFEKRVLIPSTKEICKYTDMLVSYELTKRGRKVTKIVFNVQMKKNVDAYKAYVEVLEMINRQKKQIKGQMSIFDKSENEFAEERVNAIGEEIEVIQD